MRESPFGFEYSFAEIWQVPILTGALFAGQAVGAAVGCFALSLPDALQRLWVGAMLGMAPGYVLGGLLQWRLRPGPLAENALMVRRMGLVVAFAGALGLHQWFGGGDPALDLRR